MTRARALWGAAHVNVYYGDRPAAAALAGEGLAMAREVGDDEAIARLLNAAGYAELFVHPVAARDKLEESVALGRTLGDDWAVADGLKMITLSWLTQARYDGMDEVLPELLRVAEGLDNAFFTSWYHVCVGVRCRAPRRPRHRSSRARAVAPRVPGRR